MRTRNTIRKLGIAAAAMMVVAIIAIATILPATAETGNVSVSGTNNAKITVAVGDGSAEFGTSLDPSGADSNSSDSVVDFQGSSGNQGSYYVWQAGGGSGNVVTVKSNKPWDGTVQASENSGTSTSMTVASGVLRYAEGTAPASYSGCTNATAFQSTAQTWKSSVAKGKSTYAHFYCLRVDWDDDPGTFSSNVTYTVTQAQ